MATFYVETPWDTSPDSTSTYNIYAPDDMWIIGNAVNPTYKSDMNVIEDLEGGAPKGSLITVYKNRLMIAGNLDFPHRIHYSHFNNAEGWSRDTDWIDVYPDDGGIINGLNIVNDELIISKSNGRKYGWRIYEDGNPRSSVLRVIETDKGNIARKASTVLDDVEYYIDQDGLFSVPKTTAQGGNIGYIIKEVFDAITGSSKPTVAMGSNDGKVYASIGTVTFEADDEVTVTDCVAVFDQVNNALYLRDRMPAQVFSRFLDSSNDEELYFGDDTGKVFKLNTGNLAGLDDITMLIRTKAYFKEEEFNVIPKKVGVMMTDPDNTLVFARTRPEEGFVVQMGAVTDTPIQWLDVPEGTGECPFFQLQFAHTGSSARPALLGFIILYQVAGHDQDNDAK